MDGWTEHVIWWHVFPLGFTGAERAAGDAQPRLRRLEPWLDYLLELGCNGLALGPVFTSSTHGYDTVDHFHVDPRLGTDDDLRWLFDTCRSRGVHVMLDGVFHHVGRDFPRVPRRPGARAGVPLGAVVPPGPGARAGPDGFGYRDFEGHRELVALNHEEPEVLDHIVAVMDHWLDAGRERLAAGRRVRDPAPGAAVDRRRGPGPASRRVARGRGDPRRLRLVRAGRRAGLRHPVRAVEGGLELVQRREPVRAGLGAGAPRRVRRRVRADDVRGQSRRHADSEPARRSRPARPRTGRAVRRGRRAVGLLRRRAGVPRGEGGAGRWRRRGAPRVPRRRRPSWHRTAGRCSAPTRS